MWPESAVEGEGAEQPGRATELQRREEDQPAEEPGEGQPGAPREVPPPPPLVGQEVGGGTEDTGLPKRGRPARGGVASTSTEGGRKETVEGGGWEALKGAGIGRGRGPSGGGKRIESWPRAGGEKATEGRPWVPIGPGEARVVSGKRKGGPDEETEVGGGDKPESPAVDPVGGNRQTGGAGIPVLLPAGSEPSQGRGAATSGLACVGLEPHARGCGAVEGARERGSAAGGACGASVGVRGYMDARGVIYRLAGSPVGVQMGVLPVPCSAVSAEFPRVQHMAGVRQALGGLPRV